MQARHVSGAKKSAKGGAIRAGFGCAGSAPDSPQGSRNFAPGWRGSGAFDGQGGLKGMTDKDEAKSAGARVSDEGKARQAREEARLAAALRANLARRKQQTRARAGGDEGEGSG